jgi:hypothetical protein
VTARAGGGWVRRSLGWLNLHLLQPAPPDVAVEVRGRALGAVRVRRDRRGIHLAAAAALPLPEGVVALSMTTANVIDAERFRDCLRAVLERVGGLTASRVALVLPDPVARVAILPAGEFGNLRSGITDDVIRLKLSARTPFDVRQAHVSWTSLNGRPAAGSDVLAAAVYRPVLEGYEKASLALGLDPGLVEVAGLTLLRSALAVRRAGDWLLVNWDEDYATLMLLREGNPVLIRTLTTTPAPADIVREIASTVLYYRERLTGSGLSGVLLRSVPLATVEACSLAELELGVAAEAVDPLAQLGGVGAGATAQAVAGAAASLRGGMA